MTRQKLVDYVRAQRAYKPKRKGASSLGRYFSAWFWFPVHTAHWRMWRRTVAQLQETRCRFMELGLSLGCSGDEHSKAVAREIRKILESR